MGDAGPGEPSPGRKSLTSCFSSLTDDYVAIGADCEHIAAQIEEYILTVQGSSGACVLHTMGLVCVLGGEAGQSGGKLGQSLSVLLRFCLSGSSSAWLSLGSLRHHQWGVGS